MLLVKIMLIYSLITFGNLQVTKIIKKDVLLSRKRRYLAFPDKSNLVISFAGVKAVMQVQPTGWNWLCEMDVPFPLPSGSQWFQDLKKGKLPPQLRRRNRLHRREIFRNFETAFYSQGLNGTACVKRMICEARQFVDIESKSLVKDILSAVFVESEIELDPRYENSCQIDIFSECEIPFLKYVIGSLFSAYQ